MKSGSGRPPFGRKFERQHPLETFYV